VPALFNSGCYNYLVFSCGICVCALAMVTANNKEKILKYLFIVILFASKMRE
jgi:hypothetical protein